MHRIDPAAALARSRVPLGFVVGIVAVWLAHPDVRTLAVGGAVAAAGETLRVWAAGHLEKGREVTSSGPYRLTRHPLYLGSAVIGVGVAVASNRAAVAALVLGYLSVTIAAAIRHEEAGMRARFGGRYDAYARPRAGERGAADLPSSVDRRFSLERALRNREHHAIAGLLAVAAIFAIKAARFAR